MMRRFFRENILTIIFLIIMLFSLGIGTIKLNEHCSNRIISINKINTTCKNLGGVYENEEIEKVCNNIESFNNKEEFFSALNVLTSSMPLSSNSSFILIVLLILCNTFFITRVFKNNTLINYLQRASYKNLKIKHYIISCLSSLILPIIIILEIVICYIFTGNLTASDGVSIWSLKSLENPFIFFVIQIIITFLNGMVISNICLIVTRKKHNYFVACLVSFIVIVGLELFLEIFVSSLICYHILGTEIGNVFNILSFSNFSDSYGLAVPLIFMIIVYIITFAIVVLCYKNKELLILDCEENM